MKEYAAVVELNRVLLREQTSLQRKLAHVETQLAQEKDRAESRRSEISEIIKKVRSRLFSLGFERIVVLSLICIDKSESRIDRMSKNIQKNSILDMKERQIVTK